MSIPPNIPEAREHEICIYLFVGADLEGGNSTRPSKTGVLIIMNKGHTYWYYKSCSDVKSITFGAEFCVMKTGVYVVEALCYKLIMF